MIPLLFYNIKSEFSENKNLQKLINFYNLPQNEINPNRLQYNVQCILLKRHILGSETEHKMRKSSETHCRKPYTLRAKMPEVVNVRELKAEVGD